MMAVKYNSNLGLVELGGEHYCALIYYNFKVGLFQEKCVQRLHSAFGNEALPRAYYLGIGGLQNFVGGLVQC